MDEPTTGVTPDEAKATEAETVQATTPVAEPKTPPETVETAEKPVETPTETEGEPEGAEADSQPESAKAFQQMRQEIKRLKGQIEEKKRRESVFQTLKPSIPDVAQTPVGQQLNPQQYVDPATGQFNQEAYNRDYTLKVQERQQLLAQANAQQQTLDTIDELRAKDKYPQLDPDSGDYLPEFERKVAAEWFLQKYLGQTPSIVKIAEKEMRNFRKEEKKAMEVANKEEGVKEQASLTPETRSKPGFGGQDKLESLKKRTRKGDLEAVVERMRNIKS